MKKTGMNGRESIGMSVSLAHREIRVEGRIGMRIGMRAE
jgi:hypothetical protein